MYWTLHNRGSWNVRLQRPLPSKKSLALFVHHFVHFFWSFVLVNQSLRLKHLQLQSTASSLAPSTCNLKKRNNVKLKIVSTWLWAISILPLYYHCCCCFKRPVPLPLEQIDKTGYEAGQQKEAAGDEEADVVLLRCLEDPAWVYVRFVGS